VSVAPLPSQAPRRDPFADLESAMRDRVERLAGRVAELPRDEVLRLTLSGEHEELVPDAGFTPGDWEGMIAFAAVHAHDSRAVGALWMLPMEQPDSLPVPRLEGVYRLRFEDRTGACVDVLLSARLDPGTGRVAWGERDATPCIPWMMAEVIRRSQRVASLPFSAGDLDDNWSVALAARGTVDVYLDSVVVLVATARFRAKPLDGVPVPLDSLSAGIATARGTSWSVSRRSPALPVGRTFRAGEEWSRRDLRFSIPIEDSFDFAKSWPMFELYLAVPKTKDNPYGFAWTYAHAKQGFFDSLKPPPAPDP
jgi:hypothetical protein